MEILILAQTAEVAGDWVTVIERVVAGGASLILAVVAVIVGVAYWKQLSRNNDLERDFREKTESNGQARLTDQETLLREMLDRDREAQEVQQAATAAVQGFTLALKDHTRIEEKNERTLADLLDRLKDLERSLRDGRFRDGS